MSISYKAVENDVYRYLTKKFRAGWSPKEVGEYYMNLSGPEWHAEHAALTEFFGYPVSVPHFDATFSLKALATSVYKDIQFEESRKEQRELMSAKQEDLAGFVKETTEPGIVLDDKPFVLRKSDGSDALDELITLTFPDIATEGTAFNCSDLYEKNLAIPEGHSVYCGDRVFIVGHSITASTPVHSVTLLCMNKAGTEWIVTQVVGHIYVTKEETT